ncbi:hypothetical protein AHAS_Ahas10G0046000 [Arachis hypogaea]
MAYNYHIATLLVLLLVNSTGGALVQQQPLVLKYHNGQLLKGRITVNLLWYGTFTPIQRSIIVDFINSLSSGGPPQPSAASCFNDVSAINVILTAKDVSVDGFCSSRCGTHGSTRSVNGKARTAYVWVGNSETQCPGQCAWPFHQPIYGPQTPPLVAPNGDVGVDGMIINLATLLAGTVTNPFNNGYFQGPVTAPLEAVSACTGVFGSGAYPGYPGRVLVEKTTGASYNANGVNGRKFLLPAMWDPVTSACKTLV